ncbi:hypothetical protein R8Z57_07490 [Microbacterium sp. M3]|uniref:DUF222 domain-containing protein n=1 Tax=Microbacterium arthrosphaerae TaxID=792652 RepID=A0ABU4GZV9_9MICO|nr:MULTISPECIES: hypothetical protein [Microbacterium]MDW4572618.1 hypothetical protein [Microbacterium arthrosphaerae]MDW7606473.1 hypothetical protein [Microbacterium sp. M3]
MAERKQVIAPRSAESVRLALLAGHNADLGTAQDSFHVASHMVRSNDKSERNLVRPLVAEATVAYGRCFTKSYVAGRTQLDKIITIPREHAAAHASLMRLRNSTVAHSESVLTPSFAIVELQREQPEGAVRAVRASAMTVHPSYSAEAIDEFHALVRAVKQVLLGEIERAKAALLARLAAEDLTALWDEGQQPQLLSVSLDSWDIHSRRPDYPETNIIKVLVEPARTFLMPSSGDLFAPKIHREEGAS